MMPPSERVAIDPVPALRKARDVALRPMGLGFRDSALETLWWARYAQDRMKQLRGSIALLYAFAIGFAPVDVLVFRDDARTLLAARGSMVVLLLVTAPWVYGRRSAAALERHAQEMLLYMAAVAVFALFPMGWTVMAVADQAHLTVTLIAALFALLCIYCGSGLRFAYAAPLAISATLIYFAMLAIRGVASSEVVLTAAAFLGGESLIGLTVSFTLESMARRDFVRRLELEDASARTERLLLNLMPAALAQRLKDGEGDALERLPRATVLFATLTGFEKATAGLSPLEAVRMLDRIVGRFDRIARAHGIERIKTVGATYMAAAGVPSPRDDDAEAASKLALALRAHVRDFATQEGLPLSLRAGLATGPVVAGVIGRTRLAFDCWGDTANVASRLDSHGEADRIQLAPSTARLVEASFVVTPRGKIAVKGKGEMETAWLEGER